MTDLAANSTRMMEINNECDQLIKANHMQSAVIKRRQKQLNEQLVTTNHHVISCCMLYVRMQIHMYVGITKSSYEFLV